MKQCTNPGQVLQYCHVHIQSPPENRLNPGCLQLPAQDPDWMKHMKAWKKEAATSTTAGNPENNIGRKKWRELKKVTLVGIEPRPPDLEADALTTEPSVQLVACRVMTSRLSISNWSQKCQNLRRMIVARDCHDCHNVAPQSPPFGPTLMLSLSVHPMGLP